MNLTIAQLQILIVAAPALLALLIVPGLTISHPAFVVQAIVPAAIRASADQASHPQGDRGFASTAVGCAVLPPTPGIAAAIAASPVAIKLCAFPLFAALLAIVQPSRAP